MPNIWEVNLKSIYEQFQKCPLFIYSLTPPSSGWIINFQGKNSPMAFLEKKLIFSNTARNLTCSKRVLCIVINIYAHKLKNVYLFYNNLAWNESFSAFIDGSHNKHTSYFATFHLCEFISRIFPVYQKWWSEKKDVFSRKALSCSDWESAWLTGLSAWNIQAILMINLCFFWPILRIYIVPYVSVVSFYWLWTRNRGIQTS